MSLLGYTWRVGDIGQERAERLGVRQFSVVARDPSAHLLDGPVAVLKVETPVALEHAICQVVVDALNQVEEGEHVSADDVSQPG